jgi:hypothetical protein
MPQYPILKIHPDIRRNEVPPTEPTLAQSKQTTFRAFFYAAILFHENQPPEISDRLQEIDQKLF